jgi:hypothetical protein
VLYLRALFHMYLPKQALQHCGEQQLACGMDPCIAPGSIFSLLLASTTVRWKSLTTWLRRQFDPRNAEQHRQRCPHERWTYRTGNLSMLNKEQ